MLKWNEKLMDMYGNELAWMEMTGHKWKWMELNGLTTYNQCTILADGIFSYIFCYILAWLTMVSTSDGYQPVKS